jgi:hypothetical protein
MLHTQLTVRMLTSLRFARSPRNPSSSLLITSATYTCGLLLLAPINIKNATSKVSIINNVALGFRMLAMIRRSCALLHVSLTMKMMTYCIAVMREALLWLMTLRISQTKSSSSKMTVQVGLNMILMVMIIYH